MTTFTPNFNLDLYEGTDKPDLADQYAAAMQKIDTALQAALEARAELQNSIGTLNLNLTATNKAVSDNTTAITENSTSISTLESSVASLKIEVDKNTPLVEEHVNYFADLGVTDDQSAQDLHTQIDQSHQGVMSNTQAITDLQQLEIQDNTFNVTFYNFVESGFGTFPIYVAVNESKKIAKIWGFIYNDAQQSMILNRSQIPGASNLYGLKVDVDTTLRVDSVRYFNQIAIINIKDNDRPIQSPGVVLAPDGRFYIAPTNANVPITLPSGSSITVFQIPLYMQSAAWPTDPGETQV